MADDEFDLFGDPVRLPNGKRGRPAHQPTQKLRNKVMTLLALGWSNERIANAIHCSVPTLKRYYFSELKRRAIQRDRLDAWRIEQTIEQAKEGNVGAQRLLDQLIEKNDKKVQAARLRDIQSEPRPERLGKKEIERRQAEKIASGDSSDDWDDLLKPGYEH